jgi:hypothetical protein
MGKWLGIIAICIVATCALAVLLLWSLSPQPVSVCLGLTGNTLATCIAGLDHALGLAVFKITAVSAAISAVATVALVVTIIFTSRATDAAVQASKSAEHAVQLGREAMARELRPYLSQSLTYNNYRLGTDGRISFRCIGIEWENVGNLPAVSVRARTNHVLLPGALPVDFSFPDREMSDAVTMIGTGKSFSSPTSDLTLDEVAEVLAGEKVLHVWSWVEYEGIESNRRFRSEYYASYGFFNPSGEANAEAIDLSIYNTLQDRFNGCDDTCMRHPVTKSAPRLLPKDAGRAMSRA